MTDNVFAAGAAEKLDQLHSGRQVVSDLVYDALLEAIYEGRITPGETLNDLRLAEQLSVSRTPVREALQKLRAVGLVEAAPNRYTRIVSMDGAKLARALAVWEAVYSVAIRESVPNATPRMVNALRVENKKYRKSAAKRDAVAASRYQLEFYNQILIGVTNEFTLRALDSVIHVIRLGSLSLPQWLDSEALEASQEKFIEAVAAKDVSAAIEAIRAGRSVVGAFS